MTSDTPAGAGAATLADLRTSLHGLEIDRDVVRVAGPDAVGYLQGQLSQDVAAVAPGEVAWTFVLAPQGKVDAWARLTRTGDDEVLLDVDGGAGEALLGRLRRFLLRTRADVDPLDWRVVALRGPGAEGVAREAPAAVRIPVEWPAVGVVGVDLLGPAVTLPEGVPRATAAAHEALRIGGGIPAMGAELTGSTIPAEVGQRIVDASVSFTKGCFTGQELVARIDSRGGHVPRTLRGVVLPGAPAPRPGTPVVVEGAEVGRVTSSAPAPGGGSLALAFIKRGVEPPASATVGGMPATVSDLPLPA